MPHIIPIRDLAKTAQISELCRNSKDPIYITKNGYADLVIMSAAAYDAQLAKFRVYENVMEGIKQAEDGKTRDGHEVMDKLKAKYHE